MSSEKTRDAERKREKRKSEKLVTIPECADRDRRERLEADDFAWLLWYFGEGEGVVDPFWYDFVPPQIEMIKAIQHAIKYGGDQAIAASRGEGKTTLSERLLLKYTLQGVVSFAVLFAATGGAAGDSLETIKSAIEENQRLCDDYPEVCVPVRALENAPQRAGGQIVSGHRHDNCEPYVEASSKFTWCGQEIVLPNVPGSPCARAIIATRGLDAAVRGLKKKGRRPYIALIDDPDTEDTARSEDQATKLEKRIDRGIAGLGSQRKPIARVFLSTLQSRISASYKYTDPKQKQSFKGKRFRFMLKPPERMDLWEEYIQLWKTDLESGDEFCRRSHQFYLDRQEIMDAGAEVANPHRFEPDLLPDGSQKEVSAIQHYYNLVAKLGPDAVATEYDNDPPEEAGPIESGITASRIQRQLSGYERKTIPPECILLTQGIDCRKVALHWVVRAWREDGTGFTIDYGVTEVKGTQVGVDDGVDVAVRRAIHSRMEESRDNEYATIGGEILPVHLTLVDAGWRTAAIYQACSELGMGIMPAMGFGKTAGCARPNFNPVSKASKDRVPGDGWFFSRQPTGHWLCAMDADRWKAWEHDRWMTAPDKPGTMKLYGEPSRTDRMSFDEKSHHSYARHIVSEIEIEEIVKDALVRKWKNKSNNNHWLDASYMSDVAAYIKGIRVFQSKQEQPTPRRREPSIQRQNPETPYLVSSR